MIEFLIYSDVLLYIARLEQIIYKFMKNRKDKYIVNINNLVNTNNNFKIYIIDLDSKDSIEYIQKINNIDKCLLICFSYNLRKTNLLMQRNLKYHKIISKKSLNYEQEFIDLFNKYITGELYLGKVIEYDNYKIPISEINHINTLNNNVIIKSTNLIKEEYVYNININFNKIKDQLDNKFITLNDYFISNDKSNLNINMNLHINKPISKKHKIYSKELKNKIIELYYQGKSIIELSKIYEPSYTTIYNWIKQNKYETDLKLMEKKVKKYDEICEIVKEDDNG